MKPPGSQRTSRPSWRKSTGDWREIDPFVPTEAERTDFELMFLRDKPVGRFSFQAAG